ncbi:hypothetical protein ACHAPO_001261 [Fusarium lateritium]
MKLHLRSVGRFVLKPEDRRRPNEAYKKFKKSARRVGNTKYAGWQHFVAAQQYTFHPMLTAYMVPQDYRTQSSSALEKESPSKLSMSPTRDV